MTKLTDTQLVVLSSAAKHDEGPATRPAKLNPAAAAKVASSLIEKGLVREIRAKADAPVWLENEEGRFALKITKAGREAIGVDEQETLDAAPAPEAAAPVRSKKSGSKPAMKIDAKTDAGPRKGAARTPSDQAESAPGAIRAGSRSAPRSCGNMRAWFAALAEPDASGRNDLIASAYLCAIGLLVSFAAILDDARGLSAWFGMATEPSTSGAI